MGLSVGVKVVVGVKLSVGVGVGVKVKLAVGVLVEVKVLVGVNVLVGVGVMVGVIVIVGESVMVGVKVSVGQAMVSVTALVRYDSKGNSISVSACWVKKDGTQLFIFTVKVTEAVVPLKTVPISQRISFPTSPQPAAPEQET